MGLPTAFPQRLPAASCVLACQRPLGNPVAAPLCHITWPCLACPREACALVREHEGHRLPLSVSACRNSRADVLVCVPAASWKIYFTSLHVIKSGSPPEGLFWPSPAHPNPAKGSGVGRNTDKNTDQLADRNDCRCCRDRVYLATHWCIWPPLGQSSGSWPFAAIAPVGRVQDAVSCSAFPVPQRYGDCRCVSRPARGGRVPGFCIVGS
jgi:hypothetical protein